jgi:4-diphosphocytidyl-2-C-methyl-D-erythritol kinase
LTTPGRPPPPALTIPPATVPALAKLTLSLRVTGVRADGYHLLDSEMVTIDLADTLELSAGEGVEVVAGTPTVAHSVTAVPTGPANLVARAMDLAGRRARVRLTKRIPSGGGLGGGSADAAAVLRWAQWPTDAAGLARASALGADVPFCLAAGRARVTGVGEVVEPLDWAEVAGRTFTLLVPPLVVPTVGVYRAWDALGGPTSTGPNDLEPAALHLQPELARWRDRLGEASGVTPWLAGSGSTWFVPGGFPGDGRLVVRTARP